MKSCESAVEVKTNIVVISWNALDFTRIALQRIIETVKHPYALTVVDNGSLSETRSYLGKLSTPKNCVSFNKIMNNSNVGPGAAYSQGYEVSRKLGARYTALCNNDLYFQDSWLERLESVMDSDCTIGILGTLQPTSGVIHPYFDSMDAKQVIKNTPQGLSPKHEFEYFFQGIDFGKASKDIVDVNGGGLRYLKSPPDAVPTSCAIVRNRCIEEVGFIADPRYEIYGSEDIDLSWELGKLGYKCAISNDIYTHHFRHKSVSDNNLDVDKCLLENNKKFVKKWFSTIDRLLNDCDDRGINGSSLMSDENDTTFLKLRRINDKVGFWQDK